MRKFLLALVVGATLVGACATLHPVLAINDTQFAHLNGRNPAVVIEDALRARGWQIDARRPGAIDATIVARIHRASITVNYDADSYSIAYRSSENLDYANGKIHRNYNRWIANLNRDIQQAPMGGLPPLTPSGS